MLHQVLDTFFWIYVETIFFITLIKCKHFSKDFIYKIISYSIFIYKEAIYSWLKSLWQVEREFRSCKKSWSINKIGYEKLIYSSSLG